MFTMLVAHRSGKSKLCRGVVMAQKAVVVGIVALKELKPVTNQLKV